MSVVALLEDACDGGYHDVRKVFLVVLGIEESAIKNDGFFDEFALARAVVCLPHFIRKLLRFFAHP